MSVTSSQQAATVETLMRPPTTTVEPRAHLAAAAYLMRRDHDTALIVTTDDEQHRPVGLITDGDITQAVADGRDLGETRINQIVSGPPVSVEVGTGVRQAAELMLASSVAHLPVVRDGGLVGVVDMSDICRALL
jgi:CBS domain-containing protein